MTKKQYLLAAFAAFVILMVLLLSTRLPGSRDIPKGVQIVHALIMPAPISLDRRGTHLLSTGSTLFAYAESNTVNLRPYEGQVVELKGTYEANIQKRDLPVLVVTAIKGNESEWKSWSIPSLGLELKTPKEWKVAKTGSGADFTMSGSVHPVLTINLQPMNEKEFAQNGEFGFTLTTIDGRRTALTGDGGAMRIVIDRGESDSIKTNQRLMVLVLQTDVGFAMESNLQTAFDRFLRSLHTGTFITDSSSSSTSRSTYGVSSMPSSGGLGEGSPCGGAAGILCPSGFYCAVVDREQNIGKCARL
jgi:hypothetical protein